MEHHRHRLENKRGQGAICPFLHIFPDVVVLLVEVSLPCSFEDIGGLKVTDVRRKTIPLFWSTVSRRKRVGQRF